MKIGILGETKLATALGNKYLSRGLDVVFGIREGYEAREFEWKIFNRFSDKLCTYIEAIEKSDILLICCENNYLSTICTYLSSSDLENKILIDCTNGSFSNGFCCNTLLINKKVGQKKVYKAFNNLGLDYPNSDPMGLIKETYYCGKDTPEKLKVKKIIELIGFTAIDAGEIESAFLLEAFYHLRMEISHHKRESMDYHFKLMSL